MADFCYDCIKEIFPEVPQENNDLSGLCEEGEATIAICEGCGVHWFDNLGKKIEEE